MKLVILAVLGVAIATAAVFVYIRYPDARTTAGPWNSTAVTAQYVSTQLKEVDPSTAVLLLSYDLQNNTNSDFQLADGSSSVVMARNSDRSLSSTEEVHLSYGAFLPARQRARVELRMERTFAWPAENDSAFQDKLKSFVNQQLTGLDEFVLFDRSTRYQIDFPKAWQELKVLSAFAQ